MGSAAELRRLCTRKAKAKARLRRQKRKKVKASEETESEDMLLATTFQEMREATAARKKMAKKEKTVIGKRKSWPGLKVYNCEQVASETYNDNTGGSSGISRKKWNKRMKMDETVKKLFDSDDSPTPVVKDRRRRPALGRSVLPEARLEEEALVAAEGVKNRFHPKLRPDDERDWAIGEQNSAGTAITPFKKNVDRFGKVVVKPSDCFFRSNLQTTVKEVGKLELTELHLAAIRRTPFWFLIEALLIHGSDVLGVINKKCEDDIRAIIRRFDHVDQVFRFGSKPIKMVKRDLVLTFGVVDGTDQILSQGNDYVVTPWMRRCFPDARFEGRDDRALAQLTKCSIYRNLQRLCAMDDTEHSEDVARTMHMYLMAAVFLPNANTSVAWSVCEYLEEFADICLFDWGTLIVDHLLDQLSKTTTMKISGCAMLLPYFLCERTGIIPRRPGVTFPRFISWNLQVLHTKMLGGKMEAEWERLDVVEVLMPTDEEKVRFRDLRAETQENPSQELGQTQPLLSTAIGVEGEGLFDEEYLVVTDCDDDELDCTRAPRKERLSDCEDGDALSLGEATVGNEETQEESSLDTPKKVTGTHSLVDNGPDDETVCDTPICAQRVRESVSRNSMTPPSCSLKYCSSLGMQTSDHPVCDGVLLGSNVENTRTANDEQKRLCAEVENLHTLLEESRALIGQLTDERDSVKRRLSDRSACLTLLETQCEELQAALEKLRIGMQEVTVDYIRRVSDINVEIMTLKEEWDEMTAEKEAILKGLKDTLVAAEKERDVGVYELAELKDCVATVRLAWREKEVDYVNRLKVSDDRAREFEEEIKSLKAQLILVESERDNLAGQLEGYTNPSDTQILADPENQKNIDLAAQHFVLQKQYDAKVLENDSLKLSVAAKDDIIRAIRGKRVDLLVSESGAGDRCDVVNNEVGNAIVEVPAKTPERGEPVPEMRMLPVEGTVARAVKRRTAEDTRKPKPVSPLCQAGLRFVRGAHRSNVITGKFVWDRAFPAIGRTIGPVMERLRLAFEQPNGTVIWSGKGPFSYLTAEDALRVLHSEEVSIELMDCWGEIMLAVDLAKPKPHSSYVITGKLWAIMAKERCPPDLRKVIYAQFKEAVKEEIIIMPVKTPGAATDLLDEGDHWVLMKYNVKTAVWVYYNSKIPPNGALDHHFKRCQALRSTVEAIMKAALISNGRNTPLTNPIREAKLMLPADPDVCPQQCPGSNDSGVIVCHEIEKTLKRSGVGSIGKVNGRTYYETTSTYYRCRMIEGFCVPGSLD